MAKNNIINIDDRLNDLRTWLPYKKEMCETCVGSCCYMPVEIMIEDLLRLKILDEFHLELDLKDQTKVALKNPSIRRYTPSTKKFTLTQKPNGACYFLDKEGRCSIYDLRPNACRNHPRIGPKPNFCAYIKKN
jgi:Fe-S-cluster containining protein